MKIICFKVNGFRGINGGLENNAIYFNESNTIFIFGQNNTGKSSFLQAYEYFYNNNEPKKEDFHLQNPNNPITFELEIELEEQDKESISSKSKKAGYMIENYVDANSRMKLQKIWMAAEDTEAVTGKAKSKPKNSSIKEVNKTYQPKDGQWDDKFYGGIGLHQVFIDCLSKPLYIKAMPSEQETESIIKSLVALKASGVLALKESQAYTEALSKINELRDKMYDPEMLKVFKGSSLLLTTLRPM